MKKIDVENILDELRIPLGNIGYMYITDAVLMLDKNEETQALLMYEVIAKKYGTTRQNVERAIRYASHMSYKQEQEIKEKFNLDCNITNKVVIYAIYREAKRRKENF